jgi:membrane-bound ClpP family serine protease
MRIGASLFLIAVGAVLKFAVTKQITGVSIGVIGVILMIVGAVGLLITLVLMTTRRRTDVVYARDGVSYVEPVNPVDPRY